MKTIPKPHKINRRHQITTLALNIGLFAGLSAMPLHAQDDDNIPAGYTEDEWYDPGDWFDGDNIEPAGTDWWDNDGWSNSDTYDYTYNYDYDSDYGSDSSAYDNDGWSNSADYENENQTRWNQQQDRSDRNQQARSNQDSPMKSVSFNGKVDGFKKVKLKNREGKRDEHTFVRISTKNGEKRVVSLGSRVNLSDLDLEKGDRISVSGRNARIDNRDVLVASRIKVDDQTFRIRKQNRPDTERSDQQAGRNQQQDRSDRNQQARSNQDRSMKSVSFNGKVDGFKKVKLNNREGKRDEYTFVRISTKNGEKRVVSLGSRVNLSDLDLEQGDQISVSGRNARIDNRDVLVASRIKVDDQTFRIRKQNRPDTGQQVSIEGTVQDVSKASLSNDSREKNLLIRLELKNGKSCVVDLGKSTTLSDLDIEKGSEIRLQGEKTKVDGKSLIVARKFSVDGDSTRVRDKSQRNERTSRDRKQSREYSQFDSDYDSLEPASHD